MFKRSLIFTCFIAAIYPITARADTPCDMVDRVLRTLSVAKKIQTDDNSKNYTENMSALGALVDQVSLPVLFPPGTTDTLADERKAVFHYVSSVRDAVASANAQYHDYAKLTLNDGVTSEFAASVLALEHYWRCRGAISTSESETATRAKYPSVSGSSATPVPVHPDDPLKPTTATLNSRSVPSKSEISSKVNFGFPLIAKGKTLLVPLLIVLVLLTTLYLALRRSKNYKARENRRLLRVPIKVRIAKIDYTMGIVDISMNGMKIQHSGGVDEHQKLRIQLGDTWHSGQVKWSNDRFAGIKFNKPISHQILDVIIQSARLHEELV